jgi:unsaturated chondroitin disaccharide hydrolase
LLNAARMTAAYFIAHLPADEVPYWDFELPSFAGEPRDTSAAAIAASGLIELSQLDPDAARKTTYLNAAKGILTSLSSSAYLAKNTPNDAILLHGTSHKPHGNFDTGLIYGDYYFLEALLRYQGAKPPSWSAILPVVAVTASSHDGNVPQNTLDNQLSTRWSALGDGQWIRFDLGASKTISKVAVAWYLGNQRTARFDVQTSATGNAWTTVFSGQSSGTTLQQQTYDFTDRSARYLRIVGHGNSQNLWNSITEVDVYGP